MDAVKQIVAQSANTQDARGEDDGIVGHTQKGRKLMRMRTNIQGVAHSSGLFIQVTKALGSGWVANEC